MASVDDVRRLFLQAVFSRGVFSSKLARILWEKCIDAVQAAGPSVEVPKDNDNWNKFLIKLNKSIDKLDLEFRHIHDESSGREMYAMVNRKGDQIAQIATHYTPAEIAYFKAIIEGIVLAPHESFSLSSLAALREVNTVTPKSNMSKAQAEVVLSSFVSQGWLLKSKQGRYSLSTRTLLELQTYLKSTYPDDIIECTICFEIMTRGVACHTKNCKARLHNHCFAAYRRRNNGCPTCKSEWPHGAKELIPVGEGAVRDGDDSKRRVRMKDVEDSDDDE